RGEEETGGRLRIGLAASLYESVVGAIYLEGGLDEARALVRRTMGDAIARSASAAPKSPKTILQEWAQGGHHPLPMYRTLGVSGPNGSGKINLGDALRWALGENNARILRAKRNDELIFGGSETRKALGMAEAIMQLDNSSRRLPIPFAEVEVGRRLYRNGEAEYLVNRARVRLRDMQDLLAGANLADNAFVVIGQGLTAQILALRLADRLRVREEATVTG